MPSVVLPHIYSNILYMLTTSEFTILLTVLLLPLEGALYIPSALKYAILLTAPLQGFTLYKQFIQKILINKSNFEKINSCYFSIYLAPLGLN